MKNYDEILRELSPPKEKDKFRWDVYGVKAYSPSVYVTNWWYHREALPKDYDAFHPPGNTNRSTYNRLGTQEDESHWVSETMAAMRDGLGDVNLQELIKQSRPRSMLTFLSYPRTQKVRKDLLPEEIRMMLPSLPKESMKMRYSTTYNSFFRAARTAPKK